VWITKHRSSAAAAVGPVVFLRDAAKVNEQHIPNNNSDLPSLPRLSKPETTDQQDCHTIIFKSRVDRF